jgi:hypothetical protein
MGEGLKAAQPSLRDLISLPENFPGLRPGLFSSRPCEAGFAKPSSLGKACELGLQLVFGPGFLLRISGRETWLILLLALIDWHCDSGPCSVAG